MQETLQALTEKDLVKREGDERGYEITPQGAALLEHYRKLKSELRTDILGRPLPNLEDEP